MQSKVETIHDLQMFTNHFVPLWAFSCYNNICVKGG